MCCAPVFGMKQFHECDAAVSGGSYWPSQIDPKALIWTRSWQTYSKHIEVLLKSGGWSSSPAMSGPAKLTFNCPGRSRRFVIRLAYVARPWSSSAIPRRRGFASNEIRYLDCQWTWLILWLDQSDVLFRRTGWDPLSKRGCSISYKYPMLILQASEEFVWWLLRMEVLWIPWDGIGYEIRRSGIGRPRLAHCGVAGLKDAWCHSKVSSALSHMLSLHSLRTSITVLEILLTLTQISPYQNQTVCQ